MDEFIRFDKRESASTLAQKDAERAAIAKDVEAYLAKGGQIKVVDNSATGGLKSNLKTSTRPADSVFLEKAAHRAKNSKLLTELAHQLGLEGSSVFYYVSNPRGYRLQLRDTFITVALARSFDQAEIALRKYVEKL